MILIQFFQNKKYISFLLIHTNTSDFQKEGDFFCGFFFDNVYLKSIIMILVGMVALRLAGRKSLSQMTISQAVIMIAIGSILVEPVKEKSTIITILSIALFVLVLYCLEQISLKFPIFENIIFGKSKIVIEEGKIKWNNLKKLRMTKDQLEMILRQNKIGEITDVKLATLEPNGHLGYEVFEDAKAMTVGDFKKLTGDFFKNYEQNNKPKEDSSTHNLFDEVKKNK
jgi:uncharacterized membrane protein YcaP (DUF421 family)